MRPLSGLRVLDLSRVLAGPLAGRLLADLGADVVKVEPPEGDLTRLFGTRRTLARHQSGYYVQQNAGKRGIGVDLTRPGGPELVARLAARADVVVENFRPGVLARHGLDWPALSAANPRLVMLSISGYGQDGPAAHRPAYAGAVHAEAGFLDRQARVTGQPPADAQLSVADTNAGLQGLVAVLAALRMRDATGTGTHIDVAMFHSLLLTDDYVHWAFDDTPAQQASGEVWSAAAGPVLVPGTFKWVWDRARHAGVPDPAPAGADVPTKVAARRVAVAAWLASFPDEEALETALDAAGLAWGWVRTTEEALASPAATHRGVVVEVPEHGGAGGTRRIVDTPWRFSAAETGVTGGAPRPGEHNAEVLADWLGAGAGEVDALTGAEVLFSHR
jgi:CoA:oxalate CoA-transferase